MNESPMSVWRVEQLVWDKDRKTAQREILLVEARTADAVLKLLKQGSDPAFTDVIYVSNFGVIVFREQNAVQSRESSDVNCPVSDLRKRIADLENGLRQISQWSQQDQDNHDTCAMQWRGCVAIARELLKPTAESERVANLQQITPDSTTKEA